MLNGFKFLFVAVAFFVTNISCKNIIYTETEISYSPIGNLKYFNPIIIADEKDEILVQKYLVAEVYEGKKYSFFNTKIIPISINGDKIKVLIKIKNTSKGELLLNDSMIRLNYSSIVDNRASSVRFYFETKKSFLLSSNEEYSFIYDFNFIKPQCIISLTIMPFTMDVTSIYIKEIDKKVW